MNIIVVGCGKIGTTILESLVTEGHNVTAVDKNPLALTDITNIHDVMTVCGNGGDWETLEEAGESAQWVAFVERGCFKYMVHNDEEGKDYCTGFAFEGEFGPTSPIASTATCRK